MTDAVIIQIAMYLLSIGFIYGTIKTQISHLKDDIYRLEKKQDEHNGLIRRMFVVEESAKSAHHRMDRIERICDECDL